MGASAVLASLMSTDDTPCSSRWQVLTFSQPQNATESGAPPSGAQAAPLHSCKYRRLHAPATKAFSLFQQHQALGESARLSRATIATTYLHEVVVIRRLDLPNSERSNRRAGPFASASLTPPRGRRCSSTRSHPQGSHPLHDRQVVQNPSADRRPTLSVAAGADHPGRQVPRTSHRAPAV